MAHANPVRAGRGCRRHERESPKRQAGRRAACGHGADPHSRYRHPQRAGDGGDAALVAATA
eukprot:6980191-Prymnesium_polylepis.1